MARPGPGRRTTGSANSSAGSGLNRRYASNRVGPTRPEPAVSSVTEVSRAVDYQAARAAAVHELQAGVGLDLADRLGPAPDQLRHRTALDQPDQLGSQRVPGRCVAQAGDLALVPHHAGQAEARAPGDRPGDAGRLLRRAAAYRRVPMCTAGLRASGRQDTSRSRQTRISGWPSPSARSTTSRCASESAMIVMCCLAASSAARFRSARRSTVVGHQQVVAGAGGVQPEGFGQRVAHDAPVARCGQRALDQEAASQQLRRHPDRAARLGPIPRRPCPG